MTVNAGIFRQYDIRGIVGKDLTVEAARAVGGAYARYLREHGAAGEVVVSRDNRLHGEMLRDALVQGLTEAGVRVVDIGVVPTPVNYWALHNLPVAGGIQITGSHNPPEYNGFKMSVGTASIHGDHIQALYGYIRDGKIERAAAAGTVRTEQVLDRYVADVIARTGKLSRRLKVVVDAGNEIGRASCRERV